VFFDNFRVTHEHGRILEENHYYAYGLRNACISSRAYGAPGNEYGYQGEYNEFDDDIGWNDFELRNYDAQIGRFLQQDPYGQFASGYMGMGDDPINKIDEDGGWAAIGMFQGMSRLGIMATTTLGGAIVGGAIDLLSGGDGGKGLLIGASAGLVSNFVSGINWGRVAVSAAPKIGHQVIDLCVNNEPVNSFARNASYSPPQFPPFSTLLSNYPLPYEIRPDRTPINPKLPMDDNSDDPAVANFQYFNQCAIRMSITLRKSGVNLSGVRNITNPGGQTYANGNVIGATNLARFLLKYGQPQAYDGTKSDIAAVLKNKTGIIYFQGYNENYGTNLPEERSNGNVHIDLWNNDTIMAPYLGQMLDAKRVLFWEVK